MRLTLEVAHFHNLRVTRAATLSNNSWTDFKFWSLLAVSPIYLLSRFSKNMLPLLYHSIYIHFFPEQSKGKLQTSKMTQ